MIRVIDRDNREDFPYLVDRLFRFRHDVFVKERGWSEFDRAGRYETDQYDTEDAAYLVAVDEFEEIVGCCRLTPSQSPSLTVDHFSFLVEGSIPRRPDILDLTRFGVKRQSRRSSTYPELLAGLQEYCLDQGVVGATSVIRTFRMPLLQAAGMCLTPLGLPQSYQEESLVAVMFEVSEDIRDRARRNAGAHKPVLSRYPADGIRISA